MIDQSELNSRAALCRKLARREPANRTFWMAEAENWSRLSNKYFMTRTARKPLPESLRAYASNRVEFCLSWRSCVA